MLAGGSAADPEDAAMPGHHGYQKDTALILAPRQWHDLRFDRRDDGGTGVRALAGTDDSDGLLYDLALGVTLAGITPGTEVQLRAVEFASDGTVFRERPVGSAVHAVGRGRFTYAWKDALEAGLWVGVRVAQFGRADAHLTAAEASVLVWPR
ncbi:hypothetical protein Q8791_02080 [Nocardiopsis sp. CT-R113]|uniref:Uncharacterized protein n=1 Tax=Nocardiopsis codii TaxID=3065942 RepID=A0ABU7K1F5_9ACTN|nr:hypothetical protein [Nocardiopsis sp. CT-R113]MEE2036009.1 hypothetical protein [Nocardiopsis sp. CT-R113]